MSNPNAAEACNQYPNCVMLRVRDTKKTAEFYTKVLGFELKEAWPDKENPQWGNLVLDRQSIMIGGACDPEKAANFGCSAEEVTLMRRTDADYKKSVPGAGVAIYFMVGDVDRHHATIRDRGGKPETNPKNQFYGLRDFQIFDPDGYLLDFYSPIKLESCQSCGMPMQDAQPGQMYCQYCTAPDGQLRPYEQILEGTTRGYFMEHMKMPQAQAEKAAREHLAKMPAWISRKG